jgi:hypothetical protein
MGSYLNHVAEKALGQPVMLQPRVPSLFEPPPTLRLARFSPIPSLKADVEIRPDAADSVTPQYDAHIRTIPTTRENPAGPSYGHQKDSAPTSDQDTPAARITGRKPTPRLALEPNALTVQEGESDSATPESSSRPKQRITPRQFRETERTLPDAIHEATREDARLATHRSTGTSVAEARSEAVHHKDAEINQRESHSAVREEPRRVTVPERPDLAVHSQRPFPQTPTFPPTETKATEDGAREFNVSVVIGRVNVQAVFAQPAPARPVHAAPEPLLSLEQYMKQRGGQG